MKLLIYKPLIGNTCKLPLFTIPVSAGFPSPAEEYVEQLLSLDEHLIKHPQATYLMRVTGYSMKDAGINTGDVLIIDKSLIPQNNDIVIAIINGEFTVKQIKKDKDILYLQPANKDFKPIKISDEMDFKIWGVVTYIIHKA